MLFPASLKAIETIEKKLHNTVSFIESSDLQFGILENINNSIIAVYNNLYYIKEIINKYYENSQYYSKDDFNSDISGYLTNIDITANTELYENIYLVNGSYGLKDSEGKYIRFHVYYGFDDYKKIYLPNLTLQNLNILNFKISGDKISDLEIIDNAMKKVLVYRTKNLEYFNQLEYQEDTQKWYEKYSKNIKSNLEDINISQQNMLVFIKTNSYLLQNLLYQIRKDVENQLYNLEKINNENIDLTTKLITIALKLKIREFDRIVYQVNFNDIHPFKSDQTLYLRIGNQSDELEEIELRNLSSESLKINKVFIENKNDTKIYLEKIDNAIQTFNKFIKNIDENISLQSIRTVLTFDYKKIFDINYKTIDEQLNDEILLAKGYLLHLENILTFIHKLREYAIIMANHGYTIEERNKYFDYQYNFIKDISDITLTAKYNGEKIFYKKDFSYQTTQSKTSIISANLEEEFVSDNFLTLIKQINYSTAINANKSLEVLDSLLKRVINYKMKMRNYLKRLQYRGFLIRINSMKESELKTEEIINTINMLLLEMRNSILYSSSLYTTFEDIQYFNERNKSLYKELIYFMENVQGDKKLFKIQNNNLHYFYEGEFQFSQRYNFIKDLLDENNNYNLNMMSFEDANDALYNLDMAIIKLTRLKNLYIPLEYNEIQYN